MDTKEYFVRVCFQNKFKFVKIDENELNWRAFVEKGKVEDKFNIVSRIFNNCWLFFFIFSYSFVRLQNW